VLSAIVTIGACVMPAAAQASTQPTLTGETLSASPRFNAPPYPFFLPCGDGPANETGPNFTFTGTASGRYPGTFSDSGAVDYVPVYNEPDPNNAEGVVTGYHAAFKIRSQRVTVTGSERLARISRIAVCSGGLGGAGVDIAPINATYQAKIVTPTRTYYDHGTSLVKISQFFGLGQFWFGTLSDQFTSRSEDG
jgi:hypothetical protein